MGVIYTGEPQPSLECDPQRIQLGSPAPADQDPLRWMPAYFLIVGVVLGMFLLGLGAWVARVIAEVGR